MAKQMAKDQAAWTSSAEKSLQHRVAELKSQEVAFEKAEASKDETQASLIQGEIRDASTRLDSLRSALVAIIGGLQARLSHFRSAELGNQQRFTAQLKDLSAQIDKFATESDSDLRSTELSMTDLDRREREWNKTASEASAAARVDLTKSIASSVQAASTNVTSALHTSIAALESEVSGWMGANSASTDQLWQHVVTWDQAQRSAVKELQESLESFDQDRTSILASLEETARQFNESLFHQSGVFSRGLDAGESEGKELERKLNERVAEDSRASVEQIERDVKELRGEWVPALSEIEGENLDLVKNGNKSLQDALRDQYSTFLDSQKRISEALVNFQEREEQEKSSFENDLKGIAQHSSDTVQQFNSKAKASEIAVSATERHVDAVLEGLTSKQQNVISSIQKLVGWTISYLHGNVSSILNLDDKEVSNFSRIDADIKLQHLAEINYTQMHVLNELEQRVSRYEQIENEKSDELDGAVNRLQRAHSLQKAIIERNFSDVKEDTDIIINSSTEVISYLQREMALTFINLERSINSNLSAVFKSVNSTLYSSSNSLRAEIAARIAAEQAKLQSVNESLSRRLKTQLEILTNQKKVSLASIENQAKALQDLLTLTAATSQELQRRIDAVSNLTSVSFSERKKALDALAQDMKLQNSLLSATIDGQTREASRTISKDFQNRTVLESSYLDLKAEQTRKWLLDQQNAVAKDLIDLKSEVHLLTVHAGDDAQDRKLELQIDSLDRREGGYFTGIGLSMQNFSAAVPSLIKQRDLNKTRIQNRLIALKKQMRDSFNSIDSSLSAMKAQSLLSSALPSLNMTVPIISLKRRVQDLLNYLLQVRIFLISLLSLVSRCSC